jgi:formylglycine-generating enzyme
MKTKLFKLFERSFAVIILICCLNTSCTESYSDMVNVKGGTFLSGKNKEELVPLPPHSVTLSSFKISKYEVTVAQYRAFCLSTGNQMPNEPVWGWIDNHPIVNVNHYDAVAYCDWLSSKYSDNYRLPTDAEWEYAARGGSKSKGFIYSGSNDFGEVGWSYENSGGTTQAVGSKKPNELGLYDMSGNVWEWCLDWDGEYSDSPTTNPRGPADGIHREIRGGCWYEPTAVCRVTYRMHNLPQFRGVGNGFRVVCSL